VDQLQCRLSKLGVVARSKMSLDDIPGDEHRPHAAAACTANIGRLQAVFRRHQPGDCAMLTVIAQGADDRGRIGVHQPAG
jgi:hypothetical protein